NMNANADGTITGEPCACLLQVLELSAKFDDVVLRQLYLLFDAPLRLVDEAFDVARLQIHHERGAALAVVAPDRLDCLQCLELHQFSERDEAGLADAYR